MRHSKRNAKPPDTFIHGKAKIDAALARITALSGEHVNDNPDKVTWGDVRTLAEYAELLKLVTDCANHVGEFAE